MRHWRPRGIENRDSCFFNRFGQLIYAEPCGRAAGYPVPEVGIHRGRLHLTLWRAAMERLGAASVLTDHQCIGLNQNTRDVTLYFRSTATGATRASVTADIVIACDGVNSAVRRRFYPGEELCFGGINTWRGVTRAKPFLTGRSYVRIGSIQSGNLVIYPIVDDVDGQGQQLINRTAQVAQPGYERNDWNKPGRLEDFLPIFAGWTFDWLDVPDLLRRSDVIFEYPMVDREPVDRWTFGRVTLLGDAAHPMYPRGSNGSAQAILDARTLARWPRSPPTRPCARARPPGSCAPTASIRRTTSSAAWRSWWAMGPSTISIATSPAPSSNGSRTSTSASPASPPST